MFVLVFVGAVWNSWKGSVLTKLEILLCSVLLGGEFLHGLGTRWKLSWRYELAGSFPVERPGVNQGPSQ